MLKNLFCKKEVENEAQNLTIIFNKLKEYYKVSQISQKRRDKLSKTIEKFGYLPMSHKNALDTLEDSEVLFALEKKFEKEGVLKNGTFCFENGCASIFKRKNMKNATWIQTEQHNIKLINLAALGDGNKSNEVGRFLDWLRQLIILPSGNEKFGVFSTTIYLIPFHPREFGCAYLQQSSEVSQNLEDKQIKNLLSFDAKQQVQMFIKFAQLASHGVIYDILPQTGRFSKIVLSNPACVRWVDLNILFDKISQKLDNLLNLPEFENLKDEINSYKILTKQGSCENEECFKSAFEKIDSNILSFKKEISEKMAEKESQEEIVKKVSQIIAKVNQNQNIKEESDIISHGETVNALIKNGFWPFPGGAWCSCNVPVFDKMANCASFPKFKHFDINGNDVSDCANLDCQSPYFFIHLENGEKNEKVINFFIKMMEKLQQDYNFDGFRIDHIDHIVDEVSEKNGVAISYRCPREVLGKLNEYMKQKVPYFATLAEYMLWDDFLKEYHQDMHFDILWGNDIISQFQKTPEQIIADNHHLEDYNISSKMPEPLSILKTYNNQDGEFKAINQYPAQLTEDGALFKLFKYKFLPAGKNANRPMLFVDGDESFTNGGIEKVIGSEISMVRNNNNKFFKKFDAIVRFALNNELTNAGEAQLLSQDNDGFASWIISKDPLKYALLVVCNFNYPKEMINENGNFVEKQGESVCDKEIAISSDWKVECEIFYDENIEDFAEKHFNKSVSVLKFECLKPSEFKIFKLSK